MAPDLKSGAFWKLPQPDLFGKYFNGEPGGWVDKGKTQLRIAKPSIKIGDMSLGEMLEGRSPPVNDCHDVQQGG